MQSKTSFCNAEIIRKNLKRFWPIYTLVTLGGLLVPLILWFDQAVPGTRKMYPEDTLVTYLSITTDPVTILSLVYALVTAMAVWSYLYNSRSAGFFHSIPVSRKSLFFSNYISGLLIMLIPYVISGLVTTLLTLGLRSFTLKGTLIVMASVCGKTFFFFSFATLCAHLCGNVVALVVLYVTLNFLQPIVEALLTAIVSYSVFGLNFRYKGMTSVLSPVVYLIQNETYSYKYLRPDGDGYSMIDPASVGYEGGAVLLYAIVGLVLLAITFFVYKRHRNESAGEVIAARHFKPVVHITIAVVSALAGGLVLTLLFSEIQGTYYPLGLNSFMLGVFTVIVGVIAYYAGAMIMEKSFKVFNNKHLITCIVCALAEITFVMLVRFDVMGLEDYVPNAKNVISLNVNIEDNNFFLDHEADYAQIEKVIKLHESILEDRENIKADYRDYFKSWNAYKPSAVYEANDYGYYEEEDLETDPRKLVYITFSYTLKHGRVVSREYPCVIDTSAVLDAGYVKTLKDISSDPVLIGYLLHSNDGYTVESANCWVEIPDREVYRRREITAEESQRLYKAVLNDIEMGRYNPFISRIMRTYDYKGGSIGIELYFEKRTNQPDGMDGYNSAFGSTFYTECDWVYVEPTVNMISTLEVLRDFRIMYEDDEDYLLE